MKCIRDIRIWVSTRNNAEAVAIKRENKAVIITVFVYIAEVAELFEGVAEQDDGVSAEPFLALIVDAFGDADDHREEYGDNRHHQKHLDEREAGFISARSHKQINRPNAGV